LPEKIRIYGEISESHEKDFLFIKGVYGLKNNGDVLEKIIELSLPEVKSHLNKQS